jgi:alpha-glucosidase
VQLLQPHHDGSARYVEGDPEVGGHVRVRVHVPDTDDAPERLWVRSVRDGEPLVTDAHVERRAGGGAVWATDLLVTNPVTSYRFLLGYADGSYRWLNGTGVHGRDVTDASDFRLSADHRLPDWVLDQVGYQIFPDRFERDERAAPTPDWALPADWDDPVHGEGPAVPHQWYGGTLDGVRRRLDHLRGLGASLLYLTPFFEARSNHRYDACSFDRVDAALGGDAALQQLLDAAHADGLRVVGDLTTNHTGDHHAWFRTALEDPASVERGFYHFDGDGGYQAWLGVPSLPKLDHGSAEMRRRLYEAPDSTVARWLANGIDGWRIDVANMTGRFAASDLTRDVARRIRRTMAATRPDAWLLAEHGHDASLDLPGDGWHGTMDYAGFTRPLWTWLNGGGSSGPGARHDLTFLGLPVGIPERTGVDAFASMRAAHAAMPWVCRAASTSHLDSHDSPRFRTVTGGGRSGGVDRDGHGRERHLLGLALQMCLPGVPVVFMGDELGLTGFNGEHARTPMPWHRSDEWDRPTLDAYRSWIALRHRHVALRRGGLRWVHVGDDSVTFLREHPEQRVLVHVARAAHPPVLLPVSHLGADEPSQVTTLAGGDATSPEGGLVSLPAEGAGAHLYALDGAV